jgi:hypothetical protein
VQQEQPLSQAWPDAPQDEQEQSPMMMVDCWVKLKEAVSLYIYYLVWDVVLFEMVDEEKEGDKRGIYTSSHTHGYASLYLRPGSDP